MVPICRLVPIASPSGNQFFRRGLGTRLSHLLFTPVQLRVSQNASYACSVLFYVTARSGFEPGDVIVHACTTKTNHWYDVQWLLPAVRELCTETSFWRREYFQLKIDLMTCVQVVQMTLCVMAYVQWSLYNVCVHCNNKAVELWLDTWEPLTKWSQHVTLNF